MLYGDLTHPQILSALASAGHGSKVLISDGNYPHATACGPGAVRVFLNLSPGVVKAADVLRALVSAVPIEEAAVMATLKTGPYAMTSEPPVWNSYRRLLSSTDCKGELTQIERFAFYDLARGSDVCLLIATAETEIYANLLLTIGVRRC